MSTHADKVREAERKVVERAVSERHEHGGCGCLLCEVVDRLIALESETCSVCHGEGSVTVTPEPYLGGKAHSAPCPAHCASGAKREGCVTEGQAITVEEAQRQAASRHLADREDMQP